MLFQHSEVIDAIKKLASADRTPARSHCQLLNFYAEQLGYQSYHDLSQSLTALPSDNFGKVSLRLMRHICAARLPSFDCAYCNFTAFKDGSLGYYSHWIGWDKDGREVRVASPLDGMRTADQVRQFFKHPLYVIESDKELLAWKFNWLAGAVIPESLARKYFWSFFNKDHLVEENPPMDKVRAEAARRQAYLTRMFSD